MSGEQVGVSGADGDIALAAGGAGGAENEVVQELDAEDEASFRKTVRDGQVFFARRRIAVGVVMRDDDRAGAEPESGSGGGHRSRPRSGTCALRPYR